MSEVFVDRIGKEISKTFDIGLADLQFESDSIVLDEILGDRRGPHCFGDDGRVCVGGADLKGLQEERGRRRQ